MCHWIMYHINLTNGVLSSFLYHSISLTSEDSGADTPEWHGRVTFSPTKPSTSFAEISMALWQGNNEFE